MIYEVGQKVRILKDVQPAYKDDARKALDKYDYILTIKNRSDADIENKYYYDMEEETGYRWYEKYIEGKYVEPTDPKELIISRFEILDI